MNNAVVMDTTTLSSFVPCFFKFYLKELFDFFFVKESSLIFWENLLG